MKYALQIYGSYRCFEKCLPDILNHIGFDLYDYDVFILSQKSDGYSPLNENKIKSMLTGHQVIWKYIEDYPLDIHQKENELCANYTNCIKDAQLSIFPNLVTNAFVTRLWYRRYLNNLMRIQYEKENNITYDWVIRTRFDIGYYHVTRPRLSILSEKPTDKTIYVMPDIFACGPPEAINFESLLIEQWPYIYRFHKNTGKFPEGVGISTNTHERNNFMHKWLFMSEANLRAYLFSSAYKMKEINWYLNIIRPEKPPSSYTKIPLDKPITSVKYGYDPNFIDVTQKFLAKCHSKLFDFNVCNEYVACDPMPFKIKQLIITFQDNTQTIINEHTSVTFIIS